MDISCAAIPCPVILNSTCVFYEGASLVYTGINSGDNLQTALQKIDAKFEDAGLGYVFVNGIIQTAPGQPVRLGGSLISNTTIGGAYTLTFSGNLKATKLITTGGTSSQFVKGDGSLDSGPYQPSGSYISSLTGDGTATGPGAAALTLATVNATIGTFGTSTRVPVVTVNGKGLVTNITTTLITIPSGVLIFTGDVTGSGITGSPITLTLNPVNADVYGSNTFLKFAVNGKGLVTSATPVTSLDIQGALGYAPVPSTRTLSINGTSYDLSANRTWSVGTVTNVSVTAGTGISASVSTPTNTPNITITNTAPDRIVVLNSGSGISVTGTYPTFTITGTSAGGTVTNVSALTLGTTGTNLNSSVANSTTTPVITLNVPDASATNRGALTSADWTTFNSKQNGISASAPITFVGTSVGITQSSTSTNGYLSSTDWNTFNGKQPQLNGTGFVKASGTTISYDNSTYLTTISGIAAGGELSGTYPNPTLVNSAVISKVLTGFNVTGGSVVATDDILAAFGKVQNQINGLVGGLIYQGAWNANTNTPTLTSGVGTEGYFYITSVPGTTNLDGNNNWHIGDWAVFNGSVWQIIDNTDSVTSVNGFIGAVNLSTTDIAEGTNLYYTDTRARNAISAGTGISYVPSTGVITNSAPDQTVSLSNGTGISVTGSYPSFTITNTSPDQIVSLTGGGTTSISGTYPSFTITSNDAYTGTVTSVGLTSGTGISIGGSTSPITASGSFIVTNTAPDQVVALSNGTGISISGTYPNFTITNTSPSSGGTVTGTGTTNTLPKFTSASSIGDSNVKDNGNVVTINTTAGANGALQVGDYNGGIMINKASSGASLIFKNTLSSDKLWDINQVGNDFMIEESNIGSPRLYFQAGGNIGVNTITPSYLLDISGTLHSTGVVTLDNLAGSGNRMVVANATGVLSTQAITTGTVTAVTASSPLFSSGGAAPDITIQQSSGSQSGYLSSTDWTTFNNKFTLPSLTSGSVLFSNGTTITQNNANFFWDNTNTRLGLGTTTIGSKLQVNGNAAIGYSASTAAPTNGLAVSGAVSIGQTANAAQIDILSTGTVLQATGSGIGNTTFVLKNTAATFNNSLFYGVTTNTGSGFKLLDLRTNNGTTVVFTVDGAGATVCAGSVTANGVVLTGNTGTVTSVAALTLGTTGTDLSSTVATGTTTPVITLNVPTASATARGVLSSANWTTFNAKESALTFSAPLSRATNTISIPAASTTTDGYLTQGDWDIFNNKQNALSGTINTIAYWNSASSIASLALATYPSLTELSYVKGVTSAIQTQLNSKQGTLTNPVTGTGTSGRIPVFNGTSTLTNSNISESAAIVTVTTTGGNAAFVAYGSTFGSGYRGKFECRGTTNVLSMTLNSATYVDMITLQDSTLTQINSQYFGLNSNVFAYTATGTVRQLFCGTGGTPAYLVGGLSSIRASKANIENITDISWIYDLNPVKFQYRKKDIDNVTFLDELYDDVNYGLIAEDTAPIADFLCNYNPTEDGGQKLVGIEYARLTTPMLKAIQDLKKEIDLLKAEIEILKNK